LVLQFRRAILSVFFFFFFTHPFFFSFFYLPFRAGLLKQRYSVLLLTFALEIGQQLNSSVVDSSWTAVLLDSSWTELDSAQDFRLKVLSLSQRVVADYLVGTSIQLAATGLGHHAWEWATMHGHLACMQPSHLLPRLLDPLDELQLNLILEPVGGERVSDGRRAPVVQRVSAIAGLRGFFFARRQCEFTVA
jgi:hypothetical protein